MSQSFALRDERYYVSYYKALTARTICQTVFFIIAELPVFYIPFDPLQPLAIRCMMQGGLTVVLKLEDVRVTALIV